MPAKVSQIKSTADANALVNPEIKEVMVGIRELKPIKIYPLSAKDQFDLSNKLIHVLNEMGTELGVDNLSNEVALAFFQKVISENLELILEYVVDENERPAFDQLTNNQLYNIAEVIFTVNYEGFLKNSLQLVQRAKKLFSS